jgi:hypothetical protein
MSALITPIAEKAVRGWDQAGGDRVRPDHRLAQYLRLVHGVDRRRLNRGELPRIEDVLTVLDISIAENASFGRSKRPITPGARRLDFSPPELHAVHRTIVGAIAEFVSEQPAEDVAPGAVAAFTRLITEFEGDTILTTNWDGMPDRELWRVGPRPETWRPAERTVRYTPLQQTVVNFRGRRIAAPAENGTVTTLLKLHGSLNWLFCPRCQQLIINAAGDLLPETYGSMDDDCWCGATAEPLIVTPSYAKNYRNLQLAAIWREALQTLANAEEWVFVGYSLPDDDYAVRALLTRALAWKRSTGSGLRAVRVYDWTAPGLAREAEALAAASAPPNQRRAQEVNAFLELSTRYRRVVGEQAAQLQFRAGGMQAAA